MRLFESKHIVFPRDKTDVYTEIKTYPPKRFADGIEFDGVRYACRPREDCARPPFTSSVERTAGKSGP